MQTDPTDGNVTSQRLEGVDPQIGAALDALDNIYIQTASVLLQRTYSYLHLQRVSS